MELPKYHFASSTCKKCENIEAVQGVAFSLTQLLNNPIDEVTKQDTLTLLDEAARIQAHLQVQSCTCGFFIVCDEQDVPF